MSNVPRNRVHGTQQGSPGAARRPSATAATLHASVLNLQSGAGNRAVARLLARKVGWSDASTKGRGWNVDERAVGKIRRIPLEGLGEGLGNDARIRALSSESAKGKAIVLVPAGLDATKQIELMVFLHGFTEDASIRPFAGWRTLDNQPIKGVGPLMKSWRQGVDPADLPGVADTAPVRDVALDQVEQQLQESGQKQLVIVLPQGGLTSQFDKAGAMAFDSKAYVKQVVTRLQTESVWKDAKGKVVKTEPGVSRVIMSGHSGAGAALSKAAKAGEITGDLVIYDAINGSQLTLFTNYAIKRLNEDLVVLKDKSKTEAEKLAYLQSAKKLRGYTTNYYISQYLDLDDAIQRWFDKHKGELGQFAGCLRSNYFFDYLHVEHEELMRGSVAANKRKPGTGTILDAINALHAPRPASAAFCAMPKSLRERWKEIKAQEKLQQDEKAKEEQRRKAAKRKAKAGVR